MKQSAIERLEDHGDQKTARWIIHTSIEDGRNTLRTLMATPENPRLLPILEACLEDEKAMKNGGRVVMLDLLRKGIAKARAVAGAKKLGLPGEAVALVVSETASETEVLSPLQAHAETLNSSLDEIKKTHDAAMEFLRVKSTPHCLRAGLACLKAHAEFAASEPGKRGQGRKGKQINSRRELISGFTDFKDWLTQSAPRLKEATAYKYMAAARGLGLDAKSGLDAVDSALARFAHVPSLSELVSLGGGGEAPKQIEAGGQMRLDLVFEGMKGFRESAERLVMLKDQMDARRYKVAVARVYATLKELTGCAWKPADRADDDPDDIDLSALGEGSQF